jgi:hypothetical protein
MLLDALYLLGSAASCNAVVALYSKDNNEAFVTAILLSGVAGMFYGLGVLRFFRWGFALNDRRLYIGLIPAFLLFEYWILKM